MDNIFFLVFRRMRRPLISLVVVYAVTTLGLVLIPGQDDAGNPWHMDFFHALYFVSYMATTIGFGELPHAFTDAQRLWVMFSIYATVLVWLYAVGNVLALVQDQAFRRALVERRFARTVRRMREPFYLICGYGETGRELVRVITQRHQHAVVLDHDPQRVSNLQLHNLREYVPAFIADARVPRHLLEAGLKQVNCAGVVALTDVNETNLKIAITAKLLHPDIPVICRADSHEVEANMASFGTDHIIDPYDTFALMLSTALHAPGLYLLQQWLSGVSSELLTEPVYPPKKGVWLVCGFGRFGKAIHRRLLDEGIEVVVVEANPNLTGEPEGGVVAGRGTEAHTLRQAGVEHAVGLVAGTDDDADNLSIIMTARELNDELFVIARQNDDENQVVFEAVKADMVMHPSSIIAHRIRTLLATRSLPDFIRLAHFKDDGWTCELVSRISAVVDDRLPEVWEIDINTGRAAAARDWINAGHLLTVGDLGRVPGDREQGLSAIPLLLQSGQRQTLLPADDQPLHPGDHLLYCGRKHAREQQRWLLQNPVALSYAVTGESPPQSLLLRLLRRHI